MFKLPVTNVPPRRQLRVIVDVIGHQQLISLGHFFGGSELDGVTACDRFSFSRDESRDAEMLTPVSLKKHVDTTGSIVFDIILQYNQGSISELYICSYILSHGE